MEEKKLHLSFEGAKAKRDKRGSARVMASVKPGNLKSGG